MQLEGQINIDLSSVDYKTLKTIVEKNKIYFFKIIEKMSVFINGQ